MRRPRIAILTLSLALGIVPALSCGDAGSTPTGSGDPAGDPGGKGANSLPALDAAEAASAAAALEHVDPEMRATIAARALFELETKRFDASVLEGLDAMVNVSPDQRSQVMAKSLSDNIGLLDDACEGSAIGMLKSMATLAPEARTQLLVDTCKFESHGLVTRAQALKAEGLGLMFAHMLFVRIKKAGEVDPNERKLLLALALAPAEGPPPNDGEGDPALDGNPLTKPLD